MFIEQTTKFMPPQQTQAEQTNLVRQQIGGAAIEYLLVSAFSLLTALSVMGFLGVMFKTKLESMEKKLGIEIDLGDMQLWDD